ncbi:CPBP family intramembrane glutamic endopeptidase [Bacillus sp. SM2101]|uniref:CPBP family intramembrane glutamic endopeptidase n=1 Tax=Bacillaceae TaxID=186817 RepID=UPI001BDEE0B2|nr:CPBP family intramembrane glutamic endopeptidase [Bacillus sp. SM2101]
MINNRQQRLLQNMDDREILFHLYATQTLMIVAAIIFGFFLFPDFKSFKELWNLFDFRIILYGGGIALFVIITDLLFMKYLPNELIDDGGLNEKIFQHRSIPHIFFLTIVIAFSEELLFRGVIQTHFGIVVASVIFALLHFRYLQKWVLFTSVIFLSFLLGYMFLKTNNLFVTTFAHFLIDFILAVRLRLNYISSKRHSKR